MSLALTGVVVVAAPAAMADTSPPQGTPATVSADALPTWQINGVVWSEVTVGNTVYATGSFSKARPPGVAQGGAGEVSAGNIFAFDIRTGQPVSGFNHTLNGTGQVIKASPDGSRVYVGGDFTTVDGASHSHIAAFNTATGALVTAFTGGVSGQVRGIAATNSTVFVGGQFFSAAGKTRTRLAAFAASNGALASWAPTADDMIWSMVMAPDNSRVIVAGQFQNLNGQSEYGSGSLDATTGANMPWAANQILQDAGPNGAIEGLAADGNQIYGSGWAFGSGADWEGPWAADPYTGAINWLDDCHGDTYDQFPVGQVVYSVSHTHDCSAIGLFPDTNPRTHFEHTLAWTTYPTGVNKGPDVYGWNYDGIPAAGMLHWFPKFAIGSYTGQSQAAWTVSGNSNYVTFGGEFPSVNGTNQQGLVRFAVSSIAPNKMGPVVTAANTPTGVSLQAGTIRLGWKTAYDYDNKTLTYTVRRDNGPVVYTTQFDSESWDAPNIGFIDTGLTPGSTHTYQVQVTDPFGNSAFTAKSAPITVGSNVPSQYSKDVVADGAQSFWRLSEASGTTVYDWAGFTDGAAQSGVTRGVAGAIIGDSDTASAFDGSSSGYTVTNSQVAPQTTFTIEAWIKTTSNSGGKIVGYGDQSSQLSGNYDRHLYMDNQGHIWFGVYPGGVRTLSTGGTYNDGQWHQIVASLSGAGMVLYVDGLRVGKDPSTTSAQAYNGYWRIGGDNLNGWPNQPNSMFFNGAIDDVAIYPTALTLAQVQQHYTDSGRTAQGSQPPADPYGKAVYNDQPDLYWRLGESTGSTAFDSGPFANNGVYFGGVQKGVQGAVLGTSDTAVTLNGSDGLVSTVNQFTNPTVYSEELWFKTTTNQGGKLIGFGSSQSGGSSNYDRHVYMLDTGQLRFGVWTGQTNIIDSPAAYNDGQWHYMVATQGPDGMHLYVDGAQVGTNPQTQAQPYTGYWRVGGDNAWGGNSSNYFAGTIDEVAVYSSELSAGQVQARYQLGSGNTPKQPPADPYGQAVFGDQPGSYWRLGESSGSTAQDSGPLNNTGVYFGGVQKGVSGAIQGTSDTAVTLNGSNGLISSASQFNNPTVYSEELWFKTTTNQGGKLIGFGNAQSGPSGSYDRHVYMLDTGQLRFGVWTGQTNIIDSPGSYNDGQWHYLVATQGSDGMHLYVDGQQVGTNPQTQAQDYAGYWRVGGDTCWGGNSSDYFAGTIDEAAVYPNELSASDVASHYQIGLGNVPNDPPTASFTSSTDFLDASFDGSGSSDPDGTITSYSWDFGDNSPAGSGVTPSHTYAASGTYTVTLTVTDDDGATGSVSHDVTVHANQPPTAAFTWTTNTLTASFDGSGSSDADGTISSYSWDFGDNSALGSGVSPSHTYPIAGTYTVTLTVTDNKGATGSISHPVTVTAMLAADAFSRTVSGGWGTADIGGVWTPNGAASNFAVTGGVGQIKMAAAGKGPTIYLNSVSARDADAMVDLSLDKAPAGGPVYTSLSLRTSTNGEYFAQVRWMVGGTVNLDLVRLVGGVQTTLQTVTVNGLNVGVGDTLRLRFQAVGAGPTTLNAKVWKVGTSEPAGWQVTTTDNSSALQVAGGIGLRTFLAGSATNAPVTASFDNLSVH